MVSEGVQKIHFLGKLRSSRPTQFQFFLSEARWRIENHHQSVLRSPNMSTKILCYETNVVIFSLLDSCIIDEEGACMPGASTQQWRQVSHVSSFIVLVDSIQLAIGVVIPCYATGDNDSGPQVNCTCLPNVECRYQTQCFNIFYAQNYTASY